MTIVVVGLGYVGLPPALQFARSRVSVLRIDVDARKVPPLNNGQSYIKHIEPSAIAELVRSGKFSASTDFSRMKEEEAVIHTCANSSYQESVTEYLIRHRDTENEFRDWAHCIVDTRNAMASVPVAPGKVRKA